MSNDNNVPNDTDEYYETAASEEEIYLEETEEEVRAVLASDNATAECWERKREQLLARGLRSMTDENKDRSIPESPKDS